MREIIKSISEFNGKIDGEDGEDGEDGDFAGFRILTDMQVIILAIEAEQRCCEDWGYLMSEDNLDDFIGKEIVNIKIVDKTLNVTGYNAADDNDVYGYSGDAVFVNIETSGGLLQFVAYNEHEGWYGHNIIIRSNQLNHRVEV